MGQLFSGESRMTTSRHNKNLKISPLPRRGFTKMTKPPAAWLEQAFSLIEMLIVLAIFSLVLGVFFSLLLLGQKGSDIAREETQLQQNLADILSLMSEELRQAGFPPSCYYDSSYLRQSTAARNLAAHGLLEIAAQSIKFDGDINPRDHTSDNGRINYVCYYLSGTAPPYALNRVYGEIAADGSLPGSRPQKLSEQVRNLKFTYYTDAGAETADLTKVATIQILLTLQTQKVDPYTGNRRSVSETVTIRPLNL